MPRPAKREPITLGQAIDALLEYQGEGFVDKGLARRLKDFQAGWADGYTHGYKDGAEAGWHQIPEEFRTPPTER